MTDNQQPTQPSWLPRPAPTDPDQTTRTGRDDSWLRPQQMDEQEHELARRIQVHHDVLTERARRRLERGNRP